MQRNPEASIIYTIYKSLCKFSQITKLISFVRMVYTTCLIVKGHNQSIDATRMASPQLWAISISLEPFWLAQVPQPHHEQAELSIPAHNLEGGQITVATPCCYNHTTVNRECDLLFWQNPLCSRQEISSTRRCVHELWTWMLNVKMNGRTLLNWDANFPHLTSLCQSMRLPPPCRPTTHFTARHSRGGNFVYISNNLLIFE